MSNLILVRGLPGSGKSTIAKALSESNQPSCHFEADMFFVQNGEYRFDPAKISHAHGWCRENTEEALSNGMDVYVSNTFVQRWEMRPYIALAEEHGAQVQIIEVRANFGSIHSVPEEVLQKMRDKWQDLSEEELKGWEW